MREAEAHHRADIIAVQFLNLFPATRADVQETLTNMLSLASDHGLEPRHQRVYNSGPSEDNQLSHRCDPLHVVQHRWEPLSHSLQG